MPPQGRLGDRSLVPLDVHGCPGCPHTAIGPAISGSPTVNVNGRPALRVDDPGIHAACCGPNTWTALTGSATVFINGRAAHRQWDLDRHCGGLGLLIEGSPDVNVGGISIETLMIVLNLFASLLQSLNSSSSGDSPSGSDSSGSGQRRSIWDKFREAVGGVMEAGPIDAWDAAYGEDADAAEDFAGGYSDKWENNAARHGVWQARLANKHGEDTARSIGDAHERGSPDPLDSFIDQHNNNVARQIGRDADSLDDIPAEVKRAMEDGRLITRPDDPRIPADLRRPR